MSRPRFTTILMSVFAGVALLLACVGVYGVLSYTVAHRRREFGIRMAVGADRRSVLSYMLADAVRIGLFATGLGVLGAVALGRLIRGLLFEVAPLDPVVLAAVGALAFGVAVLAGVIPAWSATSVDPVAALREE
jgi:ABC-type antimicrobial peptide transport system permease subunit